MKVLYLTLTLLLSVSFYVIGRHMEARDHRTYIASLNLVGR